MIRKKPISQQGFTIVEVIVTIVVFGIGIVMLSTLISSVQYSQRNALFLDAATQAARAKIEIIRNSQYSTITNGANFTSELPSTLPPGSTGVVTVSTPANAPNSKQIDAKVTYPIGSTSREVTVSAYVDEPSI